MPIVTIHAAKTNLSKLIEQACAGEEIIIARGSEPVVKLVPIPAVKPERKAGTLKGKFTVPDSFFDPLPDDELEVWGQ
jgi:prevent-host-death family protein